MGRIGVTSHSVQVCGAVGFLLCHSSLGFCQSIRPGRFGCLVCGGSCRGKGQFVDGVNGDAWQQIHLIDHPVDDVDGAVCHALDLFQGADLHVAKEIDHIHAHRERRQAEFTEFVLNGIHAGIDADSEVIHPGKHHINRHKPRHPHAAYRLHPHSKDGHSGTHGNGDPQKRICEHGRHKGPICSYAKPGSCISGCLSDCVRCNGCCKTCNKRNKCINVVRRQADEVQHRLHGLQGHVTAHGPHLAPGKRHLLVRRVRFSCGGQHGVFHHVRRDGALAGHFAHLPGRDAHVIRNGLCDHGGLFQHAVELIAPQSAGRKGLRQLDHSSLCRLAGRARDRHLLLQLLGKGDQLVGIGEGVRGQSAQLGHHVGHVHIGAPGALRGLVDFILRGRGRLGAAGHELQAGVDLRHLVGCLHQLLHRLQAHIGPQQVLEMAGEGRRRRGGFVLCGRLFSLCTGGFSGPLGFQPFLRGKRGGLSSLCACSRSRRIGFGRGQLVSGGGKPGALRDLRGGLLQLLGGCGALLNQLDILAECGRESVFKRERFFDDGHAITSRSWPFLPLSALCQGRIGSSRS